MSATAVAHKPDGRTTRHEPRKGELLDAVGRHLLAHGVADASIRELAAGVGVSHRTLLYHFESKEKLIMLALAQVRERQQERMAELMLEHGGAADDETLERVWTAFFEPEYQQYYRLLFQIIGLGLSGPPYDEFVRQVMEDWVALIEAVLVAQGVAPERANGIATLAHAAVRGLQVDLLLTGDRARVDAAFRELLA